jgi:hypothetical protein
MAGPRNPFGRRSHSGSQIHLTRPSGSKNTATERNLGKAVCKARLAASEFPSEISNLGQIPTSSGAYLLAAFSFEHFRSNKIALFPRAPLFPPSGPLVSYLNDLHLKNNFLAIAPDESMRLAARARPAGSPVMYQRWSDLLFLHWEY